MAHGITTSGSLQDTILIEGDNGWHGLGENRTSISAADVRTAFPWNWEMTDLVLPNGNTVNDFKAVTSEGHSVGVVGDNYTMIGIDDVIALAEDIVLQHGTGKIVSCGTLHGRQDFFLDLEVGKEYRCGDDVCKPFIGLSNNAVGNRHFIGGAHTTRMVCANTLHLMLGEVKKSPRSMKIRHTRSAFNRLAEAKRILGLACAAFDQSDEEMQAMIAMAMTDVEVQSYYNKIMPLMNVPALISGENAEQYEAKVNQIDRANRKTDRIRDEWIETLQIERQILKAPTPTLWLAMNSVTKWAQHSRTVRGESEDSTMRMWSNRFSDGFDKTNEAHDLALAMI